MDNLFAQNRNLWFELMDSKRFDTILDMFRVFAPQVGKETWETTGLSETPIIPTSVETSAERIARQKNGKIRIRG
jgi:hypothetical protein